MSGVHMGRVGMGDDWWTKPALARVAVTCEDCIWFERDDRNPVAGLGRCRNGNGWKYPSAPHYCREREEFPL